MPIILKNNVDSTLAQAINASETAAIVAAGDGAKFPALGAGDYFYATLVSAQGTREIVKVTSKSIDTLAITRAQEGTTANGFAVGSRVEMRVTAASITDLVDEHDQAAEISIADAGNYYTSTNVEGALQEAAVYNQGGTGATTRTVRSRLQDSVSVKDFGAVSDGVDPATGTDNAVAFQAAIDTGKTVFVPKGNYRLSTVTISTTGQRIIGEGMGQTFIFPMDGYSCLIVANDKIEISDLEFRGKTGTGQFAAFGDCIKFDAVTFNAAFTRNIEGCKVERVMFRNLKMNGINVPHLLRESHIRECRFIGMGDAATSRSGIYMRQTLGTPTNNNIIWIDKNIFYRFNTAAIWLRRSTLISPIYSQPSYDGITISNNLIHGQLQDENGVEPVQPSPTNHVTIEDGTRTMVHGNIFTAIHPQYTGLYAVAGGTTCKNTNVSNNQMSVKEIVGGVTYNRATGNATGNFVFAWGAESVNITNNAVNGGVFNQDFLLSDGDYTTNIDVRVKDNTTEGGIILVSSASLGTWSGEIDSNNIREIKDVLELATTIKAKNGLSAFYGASQPYCLQLQYNAATSGCLIGSPSLSSFQVSSSGGTPLLVVDGTVSTRPGADNSYNLGTAAYRWATVFAGTGAINTSDERQKQDIRNLSTAETAVAARLKSLVKAYRFKDAFAAKGDAARIHVGVIAQDVTVAFATEGLDPMHYGILCYDEWVDEFDEDGNIITKAGNAYGVRYDELWAFIISAL